MVDHLLPKYVASESKHLRVKWGEAAPVRWLGSGSTHAALAKIRNEKDPWWQQYWWMENTLCGIPVPPFDGREHTDAQRENRPHTNPVCAGDVDCPACLEALNR